MTTDEAAPRTSTSGSEGPRGHPALWLAAVGTGALVVSLAQSVLIPVLPGLPQQLGASPGAVQWLLTSTLLVGAVAVPLMGRLGDMWGKRLLLLVAIGAMLAGSLITALSDDLAVLIVGRAVQGVASAAIPLGISLLASLLPAERRASSMAVISAMLGVGGALGLPFAGLVAEIGDFHLLFWVTAVAAAVAFVGVLLVVPETPDKAGGHLDWPGAVLLALALVALLLPLSQGSSWGWGSPAVVVLLGASVAAFLLLGLRERSARDPLIDLATLLRRPILLTNIASLFVGFALFASLIGTATYVQAPVTSGYGFASTTLVAGLTMLPSGIAMLVLSPVAARLIDSIGAHRTLAIGAAVIAIGWVLRMTVTATLWEVVVGSTVVGIGTGIGYAAVPSLIAEHSPRHELAAANGVNTLVRGLGSSLASAVGGAILVSATVTIAGAELPTLGSYRILFAVCAGAASLAGVLALAVPGRRDGSRA